MGFFDKLAGELKKAVSDIANDVVNDVKNSGNTNTVSTANNVAPTVKKETPQNIINSGTLPVGNYKTAEDMFYDGEDCNTEVAVSYEIPESFGEFESHADPEMCYMYMFDDSDYDDLNLNKPHISITPEFYEKIEEFQNSGTINGSIFCEKVNIGKMICRVKSHFAGYVVYYYGFERGHLNDKYALAMFYKPDVAGTPLENKLMEITDHAAQTYNETVK